MSTGLFNNRKIKNSALRGSLYEKLRDIISIDNNDNSNNSKVVDFEYGDSYIIIKTDHNFPILKNLCINLDEYEFYGYPKHIKIESYNQLINIGFYNNKGGDPALIIDGYTFECKSEYYSKPVMVRLGVSPYATYFRNCTFDIKNLAFFFDSMRNNTKRQFNGIPLITSTSGNLEKKNFILNTDSLDLYDKIFNLEKNNNKFIYGKEEYIWLYFFNIKLDILGIPTYNTPLSDNEIGNINEFLNDKWNKKRKIKGIKITAIGLI